MKNKKLIWQIPFLLILIIGSIFVIRQQRNTPFQKDEGMVFGTIYHITYQSDINYQKEIEAELQKVDNSLSPFNKTSIISRVNRNEKVKVDEMFSEVFQLAEKISGETDGAFDITVAPMVNAWGFGFKTGNPPTRQTIDSLRAIVGFHTVSLEGWLRHQEESEDDARLLCHSQGIWHRCGSEIPQEKGRSELHGRNRWRDRGKRQQRETAALAHRNQQAYG